MRRKMAVRLTTALFILIALPTQAELAQRTFVAAIGSDAAPCSLAAPCRSFAVALNNVADGGEVIVLSSAGYGTVAITRPVSIIAPAGLYAGVTATSGDAITINVATGTVLLRGLMINGAGAQNGIHATAVPILHVENTSIAEFSNDGIWIEGPGQLLIDAVDAHDCYRGVHASPLSGSIAVSINHSRFQSNSSGVTVHGSDAGTTLLVNDSLLTSNAVTGVYVASAEMIVRNCVLLSCGEAISAASAATAYVSGSMIADSNIGFKTSASLFCSFGNNQLINNLNSAYGNITPFTHQ